MKYFNDISDLDKAKLHYRNLAKQLHPDMGGTSGDFQEMQAEYKEFLLNMQQKSKVVTPSPNSTSEEKELINELRKLAKALIKNQVPQKLLTAENANNGFPIKKWLTKRYCEFFRWLIIVYV